MIQNLNNHDKITMDLFGRQTELEVFSTDYYFTGENENSPLRKKELDCLNWFVENVVIAGYKKEITAWCNEQYSMTGDTVIAEDALQDEISVGFIAVNVMGMAQAGDGSFYPEISFLGDCKCEPEHGICIGFRDKEFLGIDVQGWAL